MGKKIVIIKGYPYQKIIVNFGKLFLTVLQNYYSKYKSCKELIIEDWKMSPIYIIDYDLNQEVKYIKFSATI